MSHSRSDDGMLPVFGRFLSYVRDSNTGALLPFARSLVCPCAMCVRRRTGQPVNRSAIERPLLRRAGFTLVEMLVVLLILALLTVAAVQSLSPVADQARYDATSRTLDQVYFAVNGEKGLRQSDGTPIITGFISDVGRVPNRGASDATMLEELWTDISFTFKFRRGPTTPVDCSGIRLACGWRGPYLRVPSTTAGLVDGWMQPFEYSPTTGNLEQIVWPFVSPYDQNDSRQLNDALVSVTGSVLRGGAPANATVILLYPSPAAGDELATVTKTTTTSDPTFTFESIPIGNRAICVKYDSDSHIETRYFVVRHGGYSMPPIDVP